MFGPAQRTEWPEPRAEPGIQHILILMQSLATTMSTETNILTAHSYLIALITVPDWNTMTPPELARNCPVVDIFQPIDIRLVQALRQDLDQTIFHRIQRWRSQWHHLDEPLLRDERLNDGITALTTA